MDQQPLFSSSFGELLKTSRKRQRLTQKQLAERLGVHYNTISLWEQGAHLPDARGLVLELARHLRLDELATRQLLEASLTALTPHWTVPLPRNPLFTGREEILEMLYNGLQMEEMTTPGRPYALHGLGGVGKTQVALEYAYRHGLEYSAVLWIEAETSERVMSSILRIAETLQLPVQQEADHQRVAAAVQRWLSTHSQWLLIWDNLEDLELLQRFLPSARQGAVLITTRRPALGILAQGVELAPMEREEGMLLILRRAKVLQPETPNAQLHQLALSKFTDYVAAGELVSLLGGLPLALDQAGAYIEETGCSIADYLRRYEQQRARLLDRRGSPGAGHPHSVMTTFRLSNERLEREQRAAADLLKVCALLQAEAIPEDLFMAGAASLGPELEALASDPAHFDQAIASLRSLSLMQRHPETHTLSLHRLVQAVLREQMSDQERSEWLRRVSAALNAAFPAVTYQSWRQCERLLPHVLGVASAIPDSAGESALAEVMCKAAEYLCTHARYEQAQQLYRRALDIGNRVWGPQHPQMAHALCGQASLFYEQGHYQQARQLYQHALHIWEQAIGPDHPDLAEPLHGLGLLLWKQGEYQQAELTYQRAYAILKRALGAKHPQVANLLNSMALLAADRGKWQQAESLYQQSLEIREQQLGPEHPEVGESLNNLAFFYVEQGKYEQAEPLCERAIHIWKQAFGGEHPSLAYPIRHLADIYLEQAKYRQAESLYLQAKLLWEQALGPEHPNLAHPLHGLATLYMKQGSYKRAETFYRKALHLLEQALGPEHPQVALPLNDLAVLYTIQEKYEQAEILFQRALSIREQRLGQHHAETAQTLYDLSVFSHKRGYLEEAISLAKRALAVRSQCLGDGHPKTCASQALYTQLVQEQMPTKERQLLMGKFTTN